MKTYSYLIDGELSAEILNKIHDKIQENTPSGISFAFADKPFSIIVTVDDKITDISSNEIDELLLPFFKEQGLTLILPANTRHFSFIGEPQAKPQKTFSKKTLITAIIITLVFSVLFTYVFASGILKTPQITPQTSADIIDISDSTHQVDILNQIFAQLEFDYENLDTEKLTDLLLKAYVEASGDPYAVYYNAEEYADWLKSQEGTSAGIGITVTKSEIAINGKLITVAEILYVHEKSPAHQAGIQIGDCIYAVGKDGEYKEINTIGYDKAYELLRGEVGSMADISVYRKEEDNKFTSIDFSIERNEYESDTVYGGVYDAKEKIGVVKLLSFGLKTPKQFSNIIDELRAQGCEYFIFDLRSNPGGDLNSIRAILSYFLNPADLIISIEYSDGTNKEYYAEPVSYDEDEVYFDCSVAADEIGKYKDLKFNILTDESTASAAELFTATVRDYGLGKIIGEQRTYGKGCMQTIIPLSPYGIEGGLRVTTSMYFSKSHTVYHNVGIIPDIVEPLDTEAKKYNPYKRPYEADNQLQKAINELFK